MQKVTTAIINLLRTYHQTNPGYEQDPNCFNFQRAKIDTLVKQGQPITFILPGFPAKSPNHEKTASHFPDLGERLALRQLHQLCQRIQRLYWPGACILVCSDGHVFSDLVMVSDPHVDDYAHGLQYIIQTEQLTNLSTFSLHDYYGERDYTVMRQRLMAGYAETIEQVKRHVKTIDAMKILFNRMAGFIYEDRLAQCPEMPKNRIAELSRDISYQMIQRSNAWGQLIAQAFPEAVRLSIYPQECDSEKMGIRLLPNQDSWVTPWHRVVLQHGDRYVLVRNKDAQLMQANPVMVEGMFSHYVM